MKELSDKQLAVEVPKAFPELFPDAMKHDIKEKKTKCLGLEFVKVCSKCKGQWYVDDWPERENCKHITPIVIDWNVAMEVLRIAPRPSMYEAMRKVHKIKEPCVGDYSKNSVEYWFLFNALPGDCLIAALEAVKGVE